MMKNILDNKGSRKASQWALVFQYFWQFMVQALLGHCLTGSTITITTPCAWPAPVAKSWPWPDSKCSKTVDCQMFMLRVKTLSARDSH